MGCTSSAQNMAPSLTNSVSEKDIKHSQDIDEMKEAKGVILEKENESNGIQVLPTCDTLGDSTHLDRNNKSLIDMMKPDLEKDSQANGLFKESNNENKSTNESTSNLNTDKVENKQTEEKLSKLEEVVDKVVELYVENPIESISAAAAGSGDVGAQAEHKEDVMEIQEEKTDANFEEEKEAEEAASPSQSQSSRATRWEALADIAAELPPSLAVDPITGQIYSLSK